MCAFKINTECLINIKYENITSQEKVLSLKVLLMINLVLQHYLNLKKD